MARYYTEQLKQKLTNEIKNNVSSAALFAAGALSSMAQSAVYSQNVVGYVTVTVPAYDGVHSTFAILANPFDDGKGNYLTNVISVDDGSGAILR